MYRVDTVLLMLCKYSVLLCLVLVEEGWLRYNVAIGSRARGRGTILGTNLK